MTDVEQGTVRGDRKVRTGRVISDKMDKTVVVQVANRRSHPLYKKVMQRRENFKAHDETNECRIGDLVRIVETRPISKDKRWRVVEVVEKAR
jgi:small subunit ribosomal protein S17